MSTKPKSVWLMGACTVLSNKLAGLAAWRLGDRALFSVAEKGEASQTVIPVT